MAKRPVKDTVIKTDGVEPLDLGVEEEVVTEEQLQAAIDAENSNMPELDDVQALEDGIEWLCFEWPPNSETKIIYPVRKEYVFGAPAARYRIQLISKRDIIDQATGQIVPGQNVSAQFTDSIFVTRDKNIAKLIYRSKSFQQGLLWDVLSMQAQAKEANFSALKKLVGNDPKAEERLYKELQAKFEKQ